MFNKLLIATAVLATTSSIALANAAAPYLGVSTGVNNITATNSGSFRGAPLTVFGGFGETIKNIYLGGEIFGTLGTVTLTNSAVGTAGLKTTYGIGASFIPGIMLADHTLAFLRAGIVNSRFSTIRNNSTGGQIGLGMQTNLLQNWDVRGEYDYTAYNTISGITPRSDLFNLGVVYKID
jgi:opacity protein-like surface antigen